MVDSIIFIAILKLIQSIILHNTQQMTFHLNILQLEKSICDEFCGSRGGK